MGLMDSVDVLVIGGGVAGASIVRELSRYELEVAMVEKEADVCFGVTKATHALIHSGIPGKGIPLENRTLLLGNLKMDQLCKDLDVPFERVGKLLVAFNSEELEILRMHEYNCRVGGVPGVELITDVNKIREMEPNISPKVIAALYTPTTGIVSPWELVFGLIENAKKNGVRLYVNAEVKSIFVQQDGSFIVGTEVGDVKSRYIVNAAGFGADSIARLIGDDSFKVTAVREQRIIIDKVYKGLVKHLVRALNGLKTTGDFVAPTVYGDIMIGETIEHPDDVYDVATTRDGLEGRVIPRAKDLVPSLPVRGTIKPFAGNIPRVNLKTEGGYKLIGDYLVKPSLASEKLINVVLTGSGVGAAPAIATYVVEEILPSVGLELKPKDRFDPKREGIPRFAELTDEERAKLIEKDPRWGHVVCRCEMVTEGEIVEAIRRGATTYDGVKFRTRTGMGRCQGGFDRPRVLRILSRELGIPVEKITRKGDGSYEVLYRVKELLLDARRGSDSNV
ncbi:MAG: NAD(P)/FAD-dependent oxidoreductase [Synergistetes bacterium]|nr:NAD(P)/FAD-dependent oxidoreductase [Synergistota bacterium]